MPTVETATGTTGSDISPDVNLGSPSEGELMLCMIRADDDGATTTTFTAASGWTEIEEVPGGGFSSSCAIFYKVAGASETDPAVFTMNQAANWIAHVVVVSDHGGYDTADLSPLDQSGTAVDAPTVTPAAADSLVVTMASAASFPAGTWTIPSSPNSPTQPTQSGTNAGSTQSIASAYFTHAASATGAVTWTYSETDHQMNAANFVIAPSGGGGSALPLINAYYS